MAKTRKKNKIERYIDALHRIDDKLVVITGANSGIGFEIAKVALIKGAKVVMACRNLERAESAKERLIKETGIDLIIIEQYDQSDICSIHTFTNTIKDKYANFHALVLNAGIFMPEKEVDEFHISNVYRTNYIGAQILLNDLQDLLNDSTEEKRIIIQGSVASFVHKYRNKDNFVYGEDKPFKQYCLSKLCISNLHIHQRDNDTNPYIKYLLCEPGAAPTNLFRNTKMWFKNLSVVFLSLFCCSPLEGSLSACKLMCDVVSNGDYYHPRGLFATKGLPKRYCFPVKFINQNIIKDSEEIIKIYENK